MLLGLTICHFQTDNSLLSGVERGNYQNGQNYGIMELSAGGWCASGKAIYITAPHFFTFFNFCRLYKLFSELHTFRFFA